MNSSDTPYIIELLTPKQHDESFEDKLQRFAERYRRILEHGAAVSICDNPMGNLHFTAMEVMSAMELPFDPERTLLHVNSFHRKTDLDAFLREARDRGLKYLLVVSGDGGPRLSRLEPGELGFDTKSVTSVELLRYIEREHPRHFTCGVAFSQYEPPHHEQEKLKRKLEAGARFVITQPVIGREPAVAELAGAGVDVYVGAWMSKKIELLCDCVGVMRPQGEVYDPVENLGRLDASYPAFGIYLAQLGFAREWSGIITRGAAAARAVPHVRQGAAS
jgi:methylenetetrahydrofolate reductase (NADPH)